MQTSVRGMCGRFVRTTPIDQLIELFAIHEVDCDLPPSYNVAPGQPVLAITGGPERRLRCFKWGLVPFWAKDASIGSRMINARAETLAEKPAFRQAFKKRRCVIPADGYYEWRKEEDGKTPAYFYSATEEPFAFAGLYELWQTPDGGVLQSCVIVTTEPNELARTAHHRMPVILREHEIDLWLDDRVQDETALKALLKAIPAEAMRCHDVSTRVNSPRNDTPECIEPVRKHEL
ncbi:MAG: SOS response-associated peptidase [candidate division KSB1 bacterium]|nr:SOS response-associated peptidase [candidate division KSB1 bacterium]